MRQNRSGAGNSRALGLLALALPLAACAVGPDFEKPAPPTVTSYTQAPLPSAVSATNAPGGDAQRFIAGRNVTGDWWTLFHSKPLDELIEQSLKNNPDLAAAESALKQAHETTLAQKGAYFPRVDAGFSASRQQQAASLAPIPSNNALTFNLFTPEVAVSYTPDVFGLNRRTVESLKAQEEGARYQTVATYNTLTSNVAVAAIELGAVDAQVAATRELIEMNRKMLDILQYRFDKGYASGVDLAAQKSQLATAEATLPPLVKQQAQLRDMLADLAGRFPSDAPEDRFALSSLTLPSDIPVSLPSKLVEQRPDVLQAEENLHAASAEIGIAIANRLPNIQLTANAGSTALEIGQLFGPGTGFWSIGAALAAPIFEGGTLLHQERAARANYDRAAAQYKSTVLAAFQNVADTLTALSQDADALRAAATADDAAKRTLDLAEVQIKDGYISPLQLLNAEQAYRQAHINLISAEASRFTDTVALFQALGGGWWNRAKMNGGEHHG